jgi:hypothetical protein
MLHNLINYLMVDTHCIYFTNIYRLKPFEEIVAVFVRIVYNTPISCVRTNVRFVHLKFKHALNTALNAKRRRLVLT